MLILGSDPTLEVNEKAGRALAILKSAIDELERALEEVEKVVVWAVKEAV